MNTFRCARVRALASGALVTLALAATARAQTPDAPADSAAAPAAPSRYARAAWLTDRMPLQVGDLLTVVVDEQTAARERVGRYATGNRSQRAELHALINDDPNDFSIKSGLDNQSRDMGEAQREGRLTAVLTVKVTQIAPNGVATIEGSKSVVVDGRAQDVSITGSVRAEDVSTTNFVKSGSIANAVITYKGKTIGPRNGLIGKILAMLWP